MRTSTEKMRTSTKKQRTSKKKQRTLTGKMDTSRKKQRTLPCRANPKIHTAPPRRSQGLLWDTYILCIYTAVFSVPKGSWETIPFLTKCLLLHLGHSIWQVYNYLSYIGNLKYF